MKSFIMSLFLVLFILLNGYITQAANNFTELPNLYNVKKFGAKGDNKTDDTKAIQSAINAAFKAGGGTVYFPNGIYIIAGPVIDSVDKFYCHSQLYIPFSIMEQSRTIRFLGESVPDFETQGIREVVPSQNGVVLFSTIITNDSAASVIGALKGAGDNWLPWNCTTPYVNDLAVRTHSETGNAQVLNSMGGINFRYASKCSIDNIIIDRGSALSVLADPALTKSAGLVTPEVNNHALVAIGTIRISGYAVGVRFSEHFVAKDLQIVCCNVGIVSEFGHHSSSIQTLEIECCAYCIVFSPGHNLFVGDYNTEHNNDNKWYHFVEDITFSGKSYYDAKIIIGLCHPVVSYIGYDFNNFKTNDSGRVVLLELNAEKKK